MVDAHFAVPRLAEIYDALDPDRSDLGAYLAMADEFDASSVLDLGCGTGVLACLLAQRGKDVVGVDPALASIEVARRQPGAEAVRWLVGDATGLPPLQLDLVTMTGNVAQVFVDDGAWSATLAALGAVLSGDGRLVFETRDPAREAWRDWTREKTYRSVELPGSGEVETWTELTAVELPSVSFRTTFVFASDGAVLFSDSTLRFRQHEEIVQSLHDVGLAVDEEREAPDRPGCEMVFVAIKGGAQPRRGATFDRVVERTVPTSTDAGAIRTVRRGYDRLSELYRSDDDEPAAYRHWLDDLSARLRPASRVLDLGCGNGVPVARRLTDAGHLVTGIDLSDRQAERARSLVPGATFICGDMTVHDFGVATFDAVVALYSLIHVPLGLQPFVIRRIAAALQDSGLFLAIVGWDAWTGTDLDWLGGGAEMWWSHADRATYGEWFEAAGFEIESMERVAEGPDTGHALVWARRQPSAPAGGRTL